MSRKKGYGDTVLYHNTLRLPSRATSVYDVCNVVLAERALYQNRTICRGWSTLQAGCGIEIVDPDDVFTELSVSPWIAADSQNTVGLEIDQDITEPLL
jgi:hypothetical protein